MEQKSNERPGVSVDIALEKLHKSGIEMKRQGLTRYLRSGEILGTPPRPEYPKEGWVVDVDSLQEFIDLKTMSVNDLRILVKKLRSEIKELKSNAKDDPAAVKEDIPEGQMNIDDVPGMVTLEIARTDIQNVPELTTKQKNELKVSLFKGVPKREKLKVEVPAGTTIEQFIKDKIKKPE